MSWFCKNISYAATISGKAGKYSNTVSWRVARIFFINRFFFPDHSATSQLLSDLAFHLADSGLKVAVITGRQGYDDPDASLPARESVHGVQIWRIWTSRFGRNRLMGRAIDYLTFYLSAAWRLAVEARRGDVIVAETDPPLISVVAAAVSRVRRAVLVNWIQDLFPEVAVALHVKGIGAVAPFLRFLRDASLKHAEINVVLGELMAEGLRRRGVPRQHIRVIPNWADGAQIQPVPPDGNALRREWGLSDKFVVGYSGNMGRAHEFDTLLDIADALKHDPAFAFVLIGDGARRPWIEEEVRRRGLGNVVLKPYQPRDRLAHSLGVPDVHVVSLIPELEGLVVPSKIYGALAAGRPILFIGDTDGEVARMLRQGACGTVVAPGDPKTATEFLKDLAASPERLRQAGINARRSLERRYDKASALRAWQSTLEKVTA